MGELMEFVHRRPVPPLDAWIELIWVCRNRPRPRAFERILPTGAAQLIVNLAEDQTRAYTHKGGRLGCITSPGTILNGISTRFQIIDTDEQQYVAGAAFRPGGIVPFVAGPVSELRDLDVPIEALWGTRGAARLREQLLECSSPATVLDSLEGALLMARRDRLRHPAVGFALTAFHARPSSINRVSAVTEQVGLSPKRFIERFKAEVGVTPKRYCRLLRFQQAVSHAHTAAPIDWAALAASCGYFDQAHFIHEFREFSGLTPSAYEEARTTFQNHVTFLQSGEERHL